MSDDITRNTRRQSYDEIQPELGHREAEVYDLLLKHTHGLTAWEIAGILKREVYTVRPRLTNLKEKGLIQATGTRWQDRTNRSEAIWQAPIDAQLNLAFRTERQHETTTASEGSCRV